MFNIKPFFILIFLFSAAAAGERIQLLMGTFASVRIEAGDDRCMEQAFRRMREVESALSSYRENSDIYRLNLEGSTAISPLTYAALQNAKRYYGQSGGYFDITVGSVTRRLYRFGEAERVPEHGELEAARVGFSGLHFDRKRAWREANITVDTGGFGKGFAVDEAMRVLKRCGVKKAQVALSGDIRCLGRCTLGIDDPLTQKPMMLFRTRIEETGISTSGNYRRYVSDKRHNHLIDPKTRISEKSFASVTLIGTAPSSDLDAWTTAAAVMPPEKALKFLERLDVGYVVVFQSGKVIESTNLKRFVE